MSPLFLAVSGVIALFAGLKKGSYWGKFRTIFGKLKTYFGHAIAATGYTGREVISVGAKSGLNAFFVNRYEIPTTRYCPGSATKRV